MPLDLTESELLSLYLFADQWICEPATDWALQRIEGLGLGASRMLGLAITLGMYSLSTSERDEIGSDAFAVISNAQLLLSDQSLMHNSYSQTNAMWYIQGHPFNGVSEECRIATIESLPPFFEIETQIYQRAVKRIGELIRMSPYSV
ncbi:hypothetical protein BDP27DRAFT_1419061 [Rhodocollybia butyracea]|uniref:Uncharacterized protein n=1 Tax=Rhodocollybia butyracea TaxID=206335 RepID=A0A9P5U9Z9_9AGAR|nr:hypothetical protein BDP27DRAFT_1419061 [Rhodocollybia butyracea]